MYAVDWYLVRKCHCSRLIADCRLQNYMVVGSTYENEKMSYCTRRRIVFINQVTYICTYVHVYIRSSTSTSTMYYIHR